MLKAYYTQRFVTILAILGCFGVVQLTLGLSEAMANPHGFKTKVVIMDCSENDVDAFEVEDISSTKDVDIKIGDDCAYALKSLLVRGYKIIPGGGGAVHAADENNEHILYTLVKEGFGFGYDFFKTPEPYNFPNP